MDFKLNGPMMIHDCVELRTQLLSSCRLPSSPSKQWMSFSKYANHLSRFMLLQTKIT